MYKYSMVNLTVVMTDICSREQWVHADHDQTQRSALSNMCLPCLPLTKMTLAKYGITRKQSGKNKNMVKHG